MKPEDTVISLKGSSNKSLRIAMEGILTEQAEISFKAGQLDQAAFDQINFDKERVEFWNKIEEAHRAGIREVVEFVERKHLIRPEREDIWQAALKEWGIE